MLCESWKTGNRLAAYGSNRHRPNLFGLTLGSRLELAVVCHTKYLFLCYPGPWSYTAPRASTHIFSTSSDIHSASCASSSLVLIRSLQTPTLHSHVSTPSSLSDYITAAHSMLAFQFGSPKIRPCVQL